MTGAFIKQASAMSAEWMVGAFVGATLDWVFSLIDSKSHVLNICSAIIQLTCATFMCHEALYTLGMRRPTNTIQNTWILWTAVVQLSPNAFKKLKDAYYTFHIFLYGRRSIPAIDHPSVATAVDDAVDAIDDLKDNHDGSNVPTRTRTRGPGPVETGYEMPIVYQ